MQRKLTLSLDDHVVTLAKQYARQQGTSLSKLLEQFLCIVTAAEEIKGKESRTVLPRITKSLAGSVKVKTFKADQNLLEEALMERWL